MGKRKLLALILLLLLSTVLGFYTGLSIKGTGESIPKGKTFIFEKAELCPEFNESFVLEYMDKDTSEVEKKVAYYAVILKKPEYCSHIRDSVVKAVCEQSSKQQVKG